MSNSPRAQENKKRKNTLNDLSGKEWVKSTISWFAPKVKSRKKKEIQHPAKYPEEIPERFISFFTKANQWIIDPFIGVGSTLVAAKGLNRNGLGIDINPKFIEIANLNLEQTEVKSSELTVQELVLGNSVEIDKILDKFVEKNKIKFDLCMTSPPYWDMLNKKRGGSNSQHTERMEKGLPLTYSEDLEYDLGNETNYNAYLEQILELFRKLKPYLKPKAHLVIVLQNLRDSDQQLRPLAWEFALKMREHYQLLQEQIWCQTDKSTGIWGYPTTYVSNLHHHYCLIFKNKTE